MAASAVTLLLLLLGWSHGERLRRQSRRAWFRWQAWTSDAPLAGVDLEHVHGALLTSWVIARNEDDEAAEAAQQTLLDALAASPPLTDLFTTLHELATPDRGLLQRHDALLDVVAAWNELLRNGAAPWWLEGNMLVGRGTAQFYVKTYRIRGTAVLRVGEERVVTRLLSRADRLNVLELALGHASPERDHAAILLHRIRDHAQDVVWPALGVTETTLAAADAPPAAPPVAEEEPPRERSPTLAALVRGEVRGALTASEWRALSSTARARQTLVQLRDHVRRRRRCGARLVLRMRQPEGLEPDTLRWLREVAAKESQFECAAITPGEVAAAEAASRTLRRAGGLQGALDRLVVWLARGVAVHEARHVADQRAHRGLESLLPCPACADDLGVRSRAELSAWLAEMAWGPSPFTTVLHACALPTRTATGRALHVLLRRLGPDTCGRPPEDLQERARRLERTLFERRERIRFVSPLPDRIGALVRS